ncbi:inositol polyphosphate 1-phosphatase-like isoform X2 [Varroa jacobsoni]|uniref:inositol polyphosphate 1-phosphatase-like isoform X2 n=1 Tax=Varroa jacobsoni TaxID=62625 RepID=UPI000BF7DCB1|nr:inositol polyphosphate 1-phosphatase-like isoform X2 [Varroa jacobsoni]
MEKMAAGGDQSADSPKSSTSSLIWGLLEVSEKAARIARECRARKELFDLLVEEKIGKDKNPRMAQDFKTLTDVLVQETVKHNLCAKWPVLKSNILGEENNLFTNAKGQGILVEVKSTEEETANLLEQVLDGNSAAAALLARAVHQEPEVEQVVRADFNRLKNALDKQDVLLEDIGIWIDPIDGTFEYIAGMWDADSASDPTIPLEQQRPHRKGLRCCTVLIGGFSKSSGSPIFSAVSQPFATPHAGPTTTFFCARSIHNVPHLPVKYNVVVSTVEEQDILEKLERASLTVTHASGAGYKLLMVALGWCDAYVLTQGSTFRWDTCAPQALLQAQGGGMRQFNSKKPIRYDVYDKQLACNTGGLIAYRNEAICRKILSVLEIE